MRALWLCCYLLNTQWHGIAMMMMATIVVKMVTTTITRGGGGGRRGGGPRHDDDYCSMTVIRLEAGCCCCMHKQDVDSQRHSPDRAHIPCLKSQEPHTVLINMDCEGLNNVFLIETSHELALRYNDSRMQTLAIAAGHCFDPRCQAEGSLAGSLALSSLATMTTMTTKLAVASVAAAAASASC